MTGFSPTILHNAYGYDGLKPVPRATVPPTNLKGEYNRSFALDWSLVERVEGQPDWTIADAVVSENVKQGRKLVAVLCSMPEWAKPLPERWMLCEAFHMTIKARYGSDIARVQSGNEVDTAPNLGHSNTDDALRLWMIASHVFGGRAIMGSFQSLGRNGEGLGRLLDLINDTLPHAIAVHLYEHESQGPADFARLLHEVRGVMIAAGCGNAELWVTEFGIYRSPTDKRPQFADMTPKDQGAWLRAAMRGIRDGGAEHAMFWHFDPANRENGGFGFKDPRVGKQVWNDAVYAVGR